MRRESKSGQSLVCGSDAVSRLIVSSADDPSVIGVAKKVRIRDGIKLGKPLLSAKFWMEPESERLTEGEIDVTKVSF